MIPEYVLLNVKYALFTKINIENKFEKVSMLRRPFRVSIHNPLQLHNDTHDHRHVDVNDTIILKGFFFVNLSIDK